MAGRPTDYTKELAQEICDRISEGVGLYRVCLADDMPSRWTVHRWMNEDPAFRDMYMHAKELAAEKIADECLDMADEAQHADSSVAVQAAKLRIDTRQWYAKVTEPKKYGTKVDIDQKTEHSGQIQMTPARARELLAEVGLDPDKLDA